MGLALNGEMRDVVMLFEALEDMSRLFRELNEELATQRSIIARLEAERDASHANCLAAQEARDDLWCENRRLAEKVTEHLEKIAQLERVLE